MKGDYVDEDRFVGWLDGVLTMAGGGGVRAYEAGWNGGKEGQKLLAIWHGFYTEMAARLPSKLMRKSVSMGRA